MKCPSEKLDIVMLLLIPTIFVWGCTSGDSNNSSPSEEAQLILGKMDLSGGWVRPGSKGGTSAVYLRISNGTATADTIQNISTQAAGKAEVHESYKGENGISGMRPAPHRVITSRTDLYLQPGGLHIMLTDLKYDLEAGDYLDLNITFSRCGLENILLPIQVQP